MMDPVTLLLATACAQGGVRLAMVLVRWLMLHQDAASQVTASRCTP
jgi:hypothetical protein